MEGGRLEQLRAIVEADLQRAGGSPAGLERAVEALRAMTPTTANREGRDLYARHVLVKAILQCGDTAAALDLATELETSVDAEDHPYFVWLCVWFDLDTVAPDRAWAPLSPAAMRVALLLARAHGADKLVDKLEHRLGTIAEEERPQ